MLEFGALLRLLRTEIGLTQTEMAELLHTSQPVYSRIEAGQKPLSIAALGRIANFVGVPVPRLILAFCCLDENLKAIEDAEDDPVIKHLLAFARKYRAQIPSHFKDAAALCLLFEEPRK